jgi:mono/diheme cytochrome c family protein
MATYEVLDAKKVLDRAYDDGDWRKEGNVVMTALDGYAARVPAVRFDEFEGYFAIARRNQPFRITMNPQREPEEIQLAPLYLVWKDLGTEAARLEMANFIPYQAYEFNLVSDKKLYERITPSDQASASVRHGFQVFKSHCMNCHRIQGAGAEKGSDLSEVLARNDEATLKGWILNPTFTGMVPLPVLDPDHAEEDAADVIRYAKYLQSRNQVAEKMPTDPTDPHPPDPKNPVGPVGSVE